MSEMLRPEVMIAFMVMTVVTVASRAGGFWLMGYINITPRIRRMLEALPGSIMVAASLPVAINGGAVVMFAITAAMIVTIVRRNDFIAVFTGMTVAALARAAVSRPALRELEEAHRALIAMHLEKDLKSVRVLREMRR